VTSKSNAKVVPFFRRESLSRSESDIAKVTSIQPRQCFGMVLLHDEARCVKVPELLSEFDIRPLRDEDAAMVHETWPNKGEGSLAYLRALIRFNKSLGVCRSDTGELIAWIFQNDFSGLGCVYLRYNRTQGSRLRFGLPFIYTTLQRVL